MNIEQNIIHRIRLIVAFLFQNPLFTISGLLAVFSIALGQLDLSTVNFEVILTLFGMMVVLALFEGSNVLKKAALALIDRSQNTRRLVQILIGLSFLSSFLLSNDVTVFTIMPIYIQMMDYLPDFKGKVYTAALIPIAANMGGNLFPFSNPQNLIIYHAMQMPPTTFVAWTAPLMAVSFVVLVLFTLRTDSIPCDVDTQDIPLQKDLLVLASIAMLVMVLCVFGVLPLPVGVAVAVISALLKFPKAFANVDYTLLCTFVFFFLLVGNVRAIPMVATWLEGTITTPLRTFLGGIFLSQAMSNVPTTILLLPFVQSAKALLLGVNIGGLGTLIGSLTNLIGYSIFAAKRPEEKQQYFRLFTTLNVIMILILIGVFQWTI